jgi:diketogulonate reductase-like aldo/keto reductase
VLSNRLVTVPVIGVTTVSHLLDAIAATRLDLSDDELHRLDLASATPAVEPGHSPWPAFSPNQQGRDTVGPKLTGAIGLGTFNPRKPFNQE